MISDHSLTAVRERTDIVDLISEYVQLKRTGQSYVGLCPFHNEKTPSFHVHASKQIFHCFGCHKGGNVFSFLSAIEGLSFPQTVEKLAQRAGVTLEKSHRDRPSPSAPVVSTTELRIFEANEWAAKYFNYLLTEVPEGKSTLEYLHSRAITPETIRRFQLGLAPKGWSTLLSLMGRRGFSAVELARAGLAIEKNDAAGKYYDRFRERLMFPIRNRDGKCVGFGARILKDEPNQPKYLNSPESETFSKRKTLYGLWENQRGIRVEAEAIIVEGYMDVIGLAQAGVANAVATMGTALTEDHCMLLRTLTRRILTVFDPDKAGNEAWQRSVHILLEAGLFARDLTLPGGKDPDEFALHEGLDRFKALCEKAPRQITKLLKEIAARGTLSEKERGDILTQLTPILIASRRLPDRALLWDDVSMILGLSHSALKSMTEPKPNPSSHGPAKPGARKPIVLSQSRRPPDKKPTFPTIELSFFRLAVQDPALFLQLPAEAWADAIQSSEILRWLRLLHLSADREEFVATLEKLVQEEGNHDLIPYASAGLFPSGAPPNAEEFAGLTQGLQRLRKEREIRALSAQIKLSQKLGDAAEQVRLLEKLSELRSDGGEKRHFSPKGNVTEESSQ